ncbi:MAG: hypothetical protein NC340_04380 [Ruminococcus flavefaciens]|nr:hypothetical protein [Ruminococcus flavefaciens]MCM1229099.1 hypothetical protein [Ruminococcus flavefaciens]
MIVLKILLWIVLAVLGIILLILFIPVSAETAYIDKKFTYKIRYGFVNLFDSDGKGIAVKFMNWKSRRKDKPEKLTEDTAEPVGSEMPEPDEIYDNTENGDVAENPDTAESEIPDTDEVRSEKPEKSEKSDKPEKEESEGRLEQLFDKLDKNESRIETVLDMLRSADRPLLYLCRGFRFSRVYIDFMIADEDAYKCALDYGRISGAVYNILGWLGSVCTVRYETVDVFPDFKAKECRWDISAKFSCKIITPIVAGISFLITYMFRFFIPQKMEEKKLRKSKKSKK